MARDLGFMELIAHTAFLRTRIEILKCQQS